MTELLRTCHAFRFLAAFAALALTDCSVNPATGERQLILVSERSEINMGREYDPQIVASMGLYQESGLQEYVQRLGGRLAATSERPNLPWTFRVVDDPVVNAFALPGGFIYVTRGILAHFESEAELAAVLGHEIGHVTARHSVSQMSKQQLMQVGLVIGMVIEPDLAPYAGVATVGLGLLFLKYGRDDERQADDLGLRYMWRGNYDPREMPRVFTMLGRVSAASGGGSVPEWLATHPNPENRQERIEQQIRALPQDLSGTLVNRASYKRRLDGIAFGDNPREGFFQENVFFQPDLRFRLSFPSGWTTSNQKQAVLAVSPRKDAIVQVTLEEQETVDAAARAFLSDEGTSGGPPTRRQVNGLPAVRAGFTARSESGTLAGSVIFVAHGGSVFRLLAYSARESWPAYRAAAERALVSFQRLTDRIALRVQPLRLSIVTLERAMTVEAFAKQYPSQVSVEMLALINQVERGQTMRAGRLVKRVVGGPLP